jgi:hypothetical protein
MAASMLVDCQRRIDCRCEPGSTGRLLPLLKTVCHQRHGRDRQGREQHGAGTQNTDASALSQIAHATRTYHVDCGKFGVQRNEW